MELSAPLLSISAPASSAPVLRRGRATQWLVGCWLTLLGSGLATTQGLPLGLHVAIATCALVMLMVVAHDAIHSAAHPSQRLNALVGWLASVACGVPFSMLMNNHLRHHRHVDTDADPERFCLGPAWQLPLRWPAMLAFYYLDTWPRLRSPARRQAALFLGSLIVLVSALPHLLWLWVLPLLCAATLFACFTVWLPHGPLAATVMRQWPALTGYHDDHHARPAFPAHQYGDLHRWHVACGVVARRPSTSSPCRGAARAAGEALARRVMEAAARSRGAIDVAPALERATVELALAGAVVEPGLLVRAEVALGRVRRGAAGARQLGALQLDLVALQVALQTGEPRGRLRARLSAGKDVVVRQALERLSRHPQARLKAEAELARVGGDAPVEALEYLGQVVKEAARLHPVEGFAVPHQAWRHAQAFDPARFAGDHRRTDFELEAIALLAGVLRRARVDLRAGFVAGPRRGLEVRVVPRA